MLQYEDEALAALMLLVDWHRLEGDTVAGTNGEQQGRGFKRHGLLQQGALLIMSRVVRWANLQSTGRGKGTKDPLWVWQAGGAGASGFKGVPTGKQRAQGGQCWRW